MQMRMTAIRMATMTMVSRMLTTLRRTTNAYSGILLASASQAGYVDAWFDFNSNGRFEHPLEHFNAGTSRYVSVGFQPCH